MIYNYLEDRAQERNTVSDSTLKEIVPPADSTTQEKHGSPINSGITGEPDNMELTGESDRSSSSRIEVDSTLSNQREREGEATEDGYDAYRRWFRGQYGDSEGSEESYDEYAGREPGYY